MSRTFVATLLVAAALALGACSAKATPASTIAPVSAIPSAAAATPTASMMPAASPSDAAASPTSPAAACPPLTAAGAVPAAANALADAQVGYTLSLTADAGSSGPTSVTGTYSTGLLTYQGTRFFNDVLAPFAGLDLAASPLTVGGNSPLTAALLPGETFGEGTVVNAYEISGFTTGTDGTVAYAGDPQVLPVSLHADQDGSAGFAAPEAPGSWVVGIAGPFTTACFSGNGAGLIRLDVTP